MRLFLLSLSILLGNFAWAGDDVGNFREIVPGLVGSAQPTVAGVRELYEKGVRVLISLRDSDSKESKIEKAEALRLGMEYHSFPMRLGQRPNPTQVYDVLKLIRTKLRANGSSTSSPFVAVHCERGSARTGLITGLFAVLIAYQPAARVYAQMAEHGFLPDQNFQVQPLADFFREAVASGRIPGVPERPSKVDTVACRKAI